jgi:hypothetical protein
MTLISQLLRDFLHSVLGWKDNVIIINHGTNVMIFSTSKDLLLRLANLWGAGGRKPLLINTTITETLIVHFY